MNRIIFGLNPRASNLLNRKYKGFTLAACVSVVVALMLELFGSLFPNVKSFRDIRHLVSIRKAFTWSGQQVMQIYEDSVARATKQRRKKERKRKGRRQELLITELCGGCLLPSLCAERRSP